MSAVRASLIVSSWNGRQLLETCLPLVLRAVEQAGGDHEIIVVDDASGDDSVEYVRREFPQVRVLALTRNLRFAGANNAAAAIATGDVLIFLNNDMLVEPGFLPPLLRHFEDDRVFAVTAHILMAPKRAGGGLVRETGLVRARFEDGMFVLRHDEPDSQEAVPVMYVGGGSSAWRRDRFLQLGGFDRLFRPFYFEDLDVSYRAQKAGWRLLFEPASRMVHQHRQTNAPKNFPGGYVDLMFTKNSLLFTWKALTDGPLLNAHFARLWRALMRPRANPGLGAAFWRAAAQLPELLAAKQRSRRTQVQGDAAVLRLASGAPSPEAAEAGELPYGSAGGGRRVLVIGFCPLPFEQELRLGALSFRTWHLAQALLADGHEVTVVGVRMAGAYADENRRPPVLRFRGAHFTYYSAAHAAFEGGELLPEICARVQPEAIVAVHAYGGWIASRLPSDAPLWVDLNGYAPAEAQARAALEGSDEPIAQAWARERATLARGDAFSVVSQRQKFATVGELFALGRLRAANHGDDRVQVMPNAIEDAPYRHRETVLRGKLAGEDDFVALWAGGYNTWTDVDLLFEGLTAAMAEEPRLRFVSLGGALPGRDEKTFYRFRERVEGSEFADRFIFAGWVPTEAVPNYYFESDVGINIDRYSYEMLIGCRYRILDMLRAGLPVVTTLGTEISQVVQEARLGMTFASGEAEGLKQALLALARDETLRRRCAERAKEYVFRHRTVMQVMEPLRRWVQAPEKARDRMKLPDEPKPRRAAIAVPSPRELARALPAKLAEAGLKSLVRRRGTATWGLDPRDPPHVTLILRAGSAALVRETATHLRARYPQVEITVLSPEALRNETAHETGEQVIGAPTAAAVSYQITRKTISALRQMRFDTILVAGEGSARAELLALLAGQARRVEVREDGAAHVLWLAPYKPLLLLLQLMAGIAEKVTLSALLGVIWGSLRGEGLVWRLRQKVAARAGRSA